MVDTSTLAGIMRASQPAPRPRRTQMRQTEPPAPRPSNPASSALNLFGSGLTKAMEPATQGVGQVMYPNTIAGINETGAPRASDVLTDAAGYAIGGAAGWALGKGIGAGAAAAAPFVPTAQARLNAMLGRLYHGVKEPGGGFDVARSRSLSERLHNWFKGDLFGTSDYLLADSYGRLGEGVRRVRNLPRDLKVLDLMPGGQPLYKQNPELARELARRYGVDKVDDLERHLPYTREVGDNFARLLDEYGYNALRHVSGQGAGRGGGREKPVYVFFNPEGMTTTPVDPLTIGLHQAAKTLTPPYSQPFTYRLHQLAQSPRRIGENVRQGASDVAENVRAPFVNAQQASRDAYQRALRDYEIREIANRRDFMDNKYAGTGLPPKPISGSLNTQPPMPPGYQPLPAPSEPGALDFLRFLFSQ
jgi:hypothetical protein